MRLDADGAVELITSSGKIIRQRGINPAIASRITVFVPNIEADRTTPELG